MTGKSGRERIIMVSKENYAIAVFDIGKTNKKILIFNTELTVLDSAFRTFPLIIKDDLELEDVEGIERWCKEQLAVFTRKYPIKAISVSTHGATFVCVNRQGKPAVPVVSYTNEPGEAFHEEFYRRMGKPKELQKVTATAQLGALINLAQGIYYVQKRFPQSFKKTKTILNYPQYFGFRFTGNAAADYTYTGCHTYLWDFKKKKWSSVAEELDIVDKLPLKIVPSWEILGRITPEVAWETGLTPDTLVTMGIHDSNAALLPYLIKLKENFVLNSTGTWCVAMHPMKEVYFTEDELGKVIFYNISALSEPVKTAIFMGGLEFETYTKLLKEINRQRKFPEFDRNLYQRIIKDKRLFILPGVVQGTGQFPDSLPRVFENEKEFALKLIESGRSVPDFFKDFNTAYAVLNLSLAIHTKIALERIGVRSGVSIFVEGGFRKNKDYNVLMSALFTGSEVKLTNLSEASAFGAAILGKIAQEKLSIESLENMFDIETETVTSQQFEGLGAYVEKFTRFL